MQEEKLLTRTEVQEILRISHSKIYRLIREKKIPSIRVGKTYRIRRSDLDEYLETEKRGEMKDASEKQGYDSSV